jgi:flagellar hook-associated protein 1 FlgK
MGLDVALQDALSGLRATQAQIQVISSNIANAQTTGYSEEKITATPIQTPTGGAGVQTGIVQRVSDQLLTSQLATQTSASSAAATTNDYMQQLQSLLGTVGSGTSFTDAYNTFVSAMQTAAATPEDPVAQSSAVNAGQQLAQDLNQFSSGIQTLRAGTDSDIGTAITTLNSALTQIGTLNSEIAQGQAQGQSVATLEDSRDQALNQVSQLIGVSSYVSSDGQMTVLASGGQTLVSGSSVSTYSYNTSGVVTAGSTLSNVTLNGQNVTSSITTGQIGALLQLRDTTLPAVTAELNQFTTNLYNLTTSANLNTTNSGTNVTNDANHFFANVNTSTGIDNAATIEVNPSLTADTSLLYDGTSGNDPTILSSMATALTSNTTFAAAGNFTSSITTTLSNYGAQIIGQASSDANNATQNNTYQSQLTSQMTSKLQSETGVNLDTELGNLTVYQNAYSASARVVSTIQTMYDALMNIGN